MIEHNMTVKKKKELTIGYMQNANESNKIL